MTSVRLPGRRIRNCRAECSRQLMKSILCVRRAMEPSKSSSMVFVEPISSSDAEKMMLSPFLSSVSK